MEQAISAWTCVSVSQQLFVQNLSYKNAFYLHENEPVLGLEHIFI